MAQVEPLGGIRARTATSATAIEPRTRARAYPMTLARLGTTSLFLGVWTPLVALAIVWVAAGLGTPIVFALEQAGVDQIDRTAVALVFAPPLPYLLALGALAVGIAVRRFRPRNQPALSVRRRAVQLWIAAGLLLSVAAPLCLYAEHGTAHAPVDDVHLVLLVSAWLWWSMTSLAIGVAIALRSHTTLANWASRSRPVAGASFGLGVLSMTTAACFAVAPASARAAVAGWAPPIDAISAESESLVAALAGPTTLSTPNSAETMPIGGGSGDDATLMRECLERLTARDRAGNALEAAREHVVRRHPSVDAEDIVMEAAFEVCKTPRDGSLGALLKVIAERRAIDSLRTRSTHARNQPGIVQLFGAPSDDSRRLEARAILLCLTAEQKDEELRAAMIDPRGAMQLAALRGIAVDSARRKIERAWQRAATRAHKCAPELLH